MATFSTQRKFFSMTFEALGNSKRVIDNISGYYKEKVPVFQKNLSSDLKKRIPGIVSTAIASKYMINKGKVFGGKKDKDTGKEEKGAGAITILSSNKGAAFLIRGYALTPRAYTPRIRPAPGKSYQIKVKIFRGGPWENLGKRNTVARVNAFPWKGATPNTAARGKAVKRMDGIWFIAHKPTLPSTENVFLAKPTSNLPWMPVYKNEKGAIRTIRSVSVPQMVSGSESLWRKPIDELVDKRSAHHMRRLGLG